MKKLIIDILKQTPEYKHGTVDFTGSQAGNGISVFSTKSDYGAFFAPHLAAMYKSMNVGCFCHYNTIMNRIELVIHGN